MSKTRVQYPRKLPRMMTFNHYCVLGIVTVMCFHFPTITAKEIRNDIQAPITKVASGNDFIFVGGENFIAHLSQELQLIHYMGIGPVEEPEYCHPNPAPCSNLIQVLEIDRHHNQLIACGSAYGGTCTMHSMNYIGDWMCMDASSSTSQSNVISACGSRSITTHFISPREAEAFSHEPPPMNMTDAHPSVLCRSDMFGYQPHPMFSEMRFHIQNMAESYKGKNTDGGSMETTLYGAVRERRESLMEGKNNNNYNNNNNGDAILLENPPSIDDMGSDFFESRLIVAGKRESQIAKSPFQPLISVRHISYGMDGNFLLSYAEDKPGTRYPGIYVDDERDEPFDVDFKLSFSSGDYSYILSVQTGSCSPDDSGRIPASCTMLGRVNNSSPSLLPYIEIPIKCNRKGKDYTFLTSATLGVVGFTQASASVKVPVLIVAFGRGEVGATEPDANYGTAICAYTIPSLDSNEFDYVQELCYEDPVSTALPWSIKTDEPCQLIRSPSGSASIAIGFLDGTMVTSMYTHTQMEIMYLYALTLTDDDGSFALRKISEMQVIKIGLNVYGVKAPDTYEMSTVLEATLDKPKYPPVGIVDKARAMMYLAYGTTIFSSNLDFCSQFTSCPTCLTLGAKQCQWCHSEKACKGVADSSCKKPFEGTCPPSLSGFEPRVVPVSGGSTLTIRGSDLGDNHTDVTVTICNKPCVNVVANVNSLTCKVQPRPECRLCDKCAIAVKRNNVVVYAKASLSYVAPNLTLFGPEFGPISGGVLLQVWGEHLTVGSQRHVEVGGVDCNILPMDWNTDEGKLTCRMAQAVGMENSCGRVKVKIDSYEVEAIHSEYCFTPDPVIDSINPRSTIESGGIRLQLTGQHFNRTPEIELSIIIQVDRHRGAHDARKMIFRCKCTRDPEDADSMECIAPNVYNETVHIFALRPDAKEIQTRVVLNRKGTVVNPTTEEEFSIQRDPVLYSLDSDSPDSYIHDGLKEKLFPIKGNYVPEWLHEDAVIIMVGETRCPVVSMTNDRIFCDVRPVLTQYEKDLESAKSTTASRLESTRPVKTTTGITTTTFITTTATSTSSTNDKTKTTAPIYSTPVAVINKTSDTPNVLINTTSVPRGTKENVTTTPTTMPRTNQTGAAPRGALLTARDERYDKGQIIRERKDETTLLNPRTYPLTVQIGNWKRRIGPVSVGRLLTEPDTTRRNDPWLRKLVIGIVGGCLLVIMIPLCGCCIYTRRKNAQLKVEKQYYMGSLSERSGGSPSGSGEPAYPTLPQILHKVLDPSKRDLANRYLIDNDHLTLGKKVGAGNFGCVYEGIVWKGKDWHVKVAVKTLQDPVSHSLNLQAFVEEAIIMMDFDHENVLSLVGLAEKEPGVPYVILPFMENGDLLAYIRDTKRSLSLYDVIQFGADICSGMAYLTSLKFVHRDLAARNCMLDSHYRAKVADFGLCRDIYEKGYYTSDNKKKLPIRWMAIESIESGAYSTKSDVWSMGVLLWELLTRGMTPYPGVDGWDIINYLRRRRLAPPYFCPENLYGLMMNCWAKEPSRRPSFKTLQNELLLLIGKEMVSTPNTPEPKRNMKIFPLNNKQDKTPNPADKILPSPDPNLVPKIKITQDDACGSKISPGKGRDDGYAKLSKNSSISASVMSLPRSTLATDVKIIIPTCYEFKDVTKEAEATYIQIVDNYEPPPRFNNPFLRSKKKRNKSSRKSKDKKQSTELSVFDETAPTSRKTVSSGYLIPCTLNGKPQTSPQPSPISRAGSEGQLLDTPRQSNYASKLTETSPYFELEHNQRASNASILAPSSCTSSVNFDKTGSILSVLDRSSFPSSMASQGSLNATQSLPRRPHNASRVSSERQSLSGHQMDNKSRGGSFGASSLKEDDVIEM